MVYAFFALVYMALLCVTRARVNQILMLPLLVLDCIGSVLVGESFGNTLSAKAWDCRTQKWWGWTHRFIDAMPWFGAGHCSVQWIRERRYGSVWAAWLADWRGA